MFKKLFLIMSAFYLGTIFAPRSGKETRKQLLEKVKKIKEEYKDLKQGIKG